MSFADKAFSGVLWAAAERFGVQLIQFGVLVVLARLLTPEDFGLVGMLAVVFAVSSVLVNGGFTEALIREREISEEDKATAFWLNLGAAVVLYGLIWISAPAVAGFFERPELVGLTRFMAVNLLFLALTLVQQAELTHGLAFRKLGLVSVSAAALTGVVAVSLAYAGFGVWALAVNYVLMAMWTSAILWLVHPWRPKFWVRRESLSRLFGFGWKLTASGLLDQIYENIYRVVIGKFFSAATLGFYTQAQTFQRAASQSIVGIFQKVTYPLLARSSDDPARLKRGYRKVIQVSCYVIFPAVVGMGLTARPLVLTMLGEKWLEAVPFLQVLCVSGALYHLHSINLNILKVVGRSDLFLRLEMIKKINTTVAIVVGLQFGIWGLLIGQVISSYVALFINMYFTRSFIDYGIREQLKDIGSVLGQSVPLAVWVLLIVAPFFSEPPGFILAAAVVGGIGTYLVTGLATRCTALQDVFRLFKARFPRLRPFSAWH